jgi:transposase, IS5 family
MIYEQQHHRANGDPKLPFKDCIVSCSKPYIRSIVRGKEIKAVDFGGKVNRLQVDGIGFIERFSYDEINHLGAESRGIFWKIFCPRAKARGVCPREI